jgi:hypothetical protein
MKSLQKNKNFPAEKRRSHRDSPKKTSATLDDFGEVRRINIFLFGSGLSGLGHCAAKL